MRTAAHAAAITSRTISGSLALRHISDWTKIVRIGKPEYGRTSEIQRTAKGLELHPFQSAFFIYPDVSDNQDGKKHNHLDQPEKAQHFELNRPREEENGFYVEDHKQDGDDVVAHRVAAARFHLRINAAFIWL